MDNFSFDDKDVDLSTYQKDLKPRNSLHIKRKLVHCLTGLGFAAFYTAVPRNYFVAGGAIASTFMFVVESLRYRKGFKWINRIYMAGFGSILRKHEMNGKMSGTFYYFAGVTLTAALFPPTAAVLGIAQLAIADPTASYFGRRTKHIYWSRLDGQLAGLGRNKGLLGFASGAVACFPLNYALLTHAQWSSVPTRATIALASALIGCAGAFADLAVPTPTISMPDKCLGVKMPPLHIDDNFVVPVFGAWCTTKIFKLLALPSMLKLSKWLIF